MMTVISERACRNTVIDLDIRAAQTKDVPDILSLYAQPDIDDGQKLEISAAQLLFEKFSEYPNYKIYIARNASVIVGTFALLIMDNLGHLGKPSAIIEDVAVSPEYHGKGIGREMMKRAMEIACDAGCYKMTLSSNLKRIKAHRFYESLGFVRHGYSYQIALLDE
jgi:GNAT superfamily N-acetyltransferase